MRVAGDPGQRVLVFDRHEWECFLDGARNGEFDDAAAAARDPGAYQNLDLRITIWVPCKARQGSCQGGEAADER